MRAPARTLRPGPKRRSGPARPACVSRVPHAEQKLAKKWLEGFDIGRKLGSDAREERLADAAVRMVLDDLGRDVDLMTSEELKDLALLMARMAGDLTRKRLAVPVESYLQEPGMVYPGNDGDIDVPLDEEDDR